jgi:hypothetical protein
VICKLRVVTVRKNEERENYHGEFAQRICA